jgi:hypothetical protein
VGAHEKMGNRARPQGLANGKGEGKAPRVSSTLAKVQATRDVGPAMYEIVFDIHVGGGGRMRSAALAE